MLVCVVSLGLVRSLPSGFQKQAATVVQSSSGLLEVSISAGNSEDTAFQNAVSPVYLEQDTSMTT